MNTTASQADLPLQAFCYLAGELSPSDAEAFEQLLASDPAAQQALVDAVQLTAALQAEPVAPAPRPQTSTTAPAAPLRRWSVALALGGCGVVAATLLVALREDPTSGVTTAQNAVAAATVVAWSELHPEDEFGPLDDMSLVAADERADAADTVPDWLLLAVADVSADRDEQPARDDAREIDDEI